MQQRWSRRFAKIMTIATIVTATISTSSARAEDCPSYLYYRNGNYLKAGDYFYYSNGTYLRAGDYLYYPNGNYLRAGAYVYYDNGNYFKAGDYLYYPNGNYLRSGDYWYYAAGGYMKAGSYFYHSNGNYARSGTTLYREDGTQTAFPVTLRESIGTVGTVAWEVRSASEQVTLDLDRFIDTDLVAGELRWLDGGVGVDFRIGTGQPGETVRLAVGADGAVTCALEGGDPAPRVFTLDEPAATVRVEVKAGYDPTRVREALQAALDGL